MIAALVGLSLLSLLPILYRKLLSKSRLRPPLASPSLLQRYSPDRILPSPCSCRRLRRRILPRLATAIVRQRRGDAQKYFPEHPSDARRSRPALLPTKDNPARRRQNRPRRACAGTIRPPRSRSLPIRHDATRARRAAARCRQLPPQTSARRRQESASRRADLPRAFLGDKSRIPLPHRRQSDPPHLPRRKRLASHDERTLATTMGQKPRGRTRSPAPKRARAARRTRLPRLSFERLPSALLDQTHVQGGGSPRRRRDSSRLPSLGFSSSPSASHDGNPARRRRTTPARRQRSTFADGGEACSLQAAAAFCRTCARALLCRSNLRCALSSLAFSAAFPPALPCLVRLECLDRDEHDRFHMRVAIAVVVRLLAGCHQSCGGVCVCVVGRCPFAYLSL